LTEFSIYVINLTRQNKIKEVKKMVKKGLLLTLVLAALIMLLPMGSAFAADRGGPKAKDLLIYEVESPGGTIFSANGFAGKGAIKNGGQIEVTFILVGIHMFPEEGIPPVSTTMTAVASLTERLNPRGKPNGYLWVAEVSFCSIPEIIWSVTHIRVELTNRSGSTVKETDVPLPYSPF
jgi:hypothetical protein